MGACCSENKEELEYKNSVISNITLVETNFHEVE